MIRWKKRFRLTLGRKSAEAPSISEVKASQFCRFENVVMLPLRYRLKANRFDKLNLVLNLYPNMTVCFCQW